MLTNEKLGLKLGTKTEVAWTQILKETELSIEQNERANILNRLIVEEAKRRIKKEQGFFKKKRGG